MTSATMTSPVRTLDARSPAPPSRPSRSVGLCASSGARRPIPAPPAGCWRLVAASTVGLMLAPLLAPSSIDQTYTSYLRFAAVGLSILLPVVSILTLTSEWSQRTVLTTFTQEPRRIRVINAKVTVSLLLAGGAAVFGGLVTAAGLGVAAASGRDLDANLNAGVLVGYLLFVLLNVLDRRGARGAAAQLGGRDRRCTSRFPSRSPCSAVHRPRWADWVDSGTTFDWVLNGEWSGHTPQILVSVILWVALPLAAGLVRTVRREIN